MPTSSPTLLQPRKAPVQARSAASVEAIVEATLQVLTAVGKGRLTTTRVAERAGVSVGTLYQYFPNKSSLLQAALRRHFDEVAAAVEQVCVGQRGCPLRSMATALVSAFLEAKMRNPRTSVALYAVSSDVDGIRLAQEISDRIHKAAVAMLRSAPDVGSMDVALVTTVMQGAMAGVSRRLLESDSPERNLPPFREELVAMVTGYLQGRSQRD